uniref:hypothetical protein n=1 Tax=Cronobacter malonaticus TaxID=413503 RepID=UPI001F256FA8
GFIFFHFGIEVALGLQPTTCSSPALLPSKRTGVNRKYPRAADAVGFIFFHFGIEVALGLQPTTCSSPALLPSKRTGV